MRVWNDPYDVAGLKMLIDFRCSDLWADPGKQQAPKAWADYSVAEKEAAVEEFIGSAGAKAVHAYNDEVKVVIHVTNPEKGNVTKWAANLDTYAVDYDVLATSYYPYWHGTLSNLESQLKTVKDTYGKDVMVAETSYAYTLEDSDGHSNTVRVGNNDSSTSYPFTVQGQANSIRDVMETVNNAGVATGWGNWGTVEVNFELTETTDIMLRIVVEIQDGGWGSVDELYLSKTGEVDVRHATVVEKVEDENGNENFVLSNEKVEGVVITGTTEILKTAKFEANVLTETSPELEEVLEQAKENKELDVKEETVVEEPVEETRTEEKSEHSSEITILGEEVPLAVNAGGDIPAWPVLLATAVFLAFVGIYVYAKQRKMIK